VKIFGHTRQALTTKNSEKTMKHMRSITSIGTAAIALAAVLSQQTANAALLAYEGFDYTAGNLDTTRNGGIGWSQAWQPTTVSGSLANQQVFSTGFTYLDGLGNSLVVSGGRAHVTGDGGATGDNIGGVGSTTSVTPTRGFNFNRGANGVAETTWMSFISLRTGLPQGSAGQPPVGASPNDYLYGRAASAQLFYNSASSTTAGSEMFAIGRATQSSETATALANDTWAILQQGNANATKVSTVNFAAGAADFLLMRIDHLPGINAVSGLLTNADTIRIWINPNLDVAPADGAADITLNANDFNPALGINRDLVFNRFRIFGGGTNATVGYGSIEMDEIRIGEGFADVTPYTSVPEPAMAALGGLGVLAIILRRRRS
jgi:hypothetical protein